MIFEVTLRRREPDEDGKHRHQYLGNVSAIVAVRWDGGAHVFSAEEWEVLEVKS